MVTPASAGQPAGCTLHVPNINQNSAGQLVGKGTASCNSATIRTFGVLIYAVKPFAPDPLVAKGDQRASLYNYTKTIYTCDGGNTKSYYSQASFTGFDYYEPGTIYVTTCS